MIQGFFACIKSPEIFTLAGLWVFLARIKAVLARLQLSDHTFVSKSESFSNLRHCAPAYLQIFNWYATPFSTRMPLQIRHRDC